MSKKKYSKLFSELDGMTGAKVNRERERRDKFYLQEVNNIKTHPL